MDVFGPSANKKAQSEIFSHDVSRARNIIAGHKTENTQKPPCSCFNFLWWDSAERKRARTTPPLLSLAARASSLWKLAPASLCALSTNRPRLQRQLIARICSHGRQRRRQRCAGACRFRVRRMPRNARGRARRLRQRM